MPKVTALDLCHGGVAGLEACVETGVQMVEVQALGIRLLSIQLFMVLFVVCLVCLL